ncbi:unnamed protein product, partial [Prorocentrum cordatum]
VAEFVDLFDYDASGGGVRGGEAALEAELARVLGEEGRGVCYVEGGNTFWLLHEARRSGLLRLLPPLLARGPSAYVGVSAGAILAGSTCETAHWKGWDDPAVVPDLEAFLAEPLRGLGLVGAAFPHFDQELWGPLVERRRGELAEPAGLHLVPDRGGALVLQVA